MFIQRIGRLIAVGILLACSGLTATAQESYPNANRIVSIGGAVTEIIYELGQQHRLIARDTTSVYPPAVLNLPDVGYMRRLSAEGILSVSPDLILTVAGSGPQETIELLSQSNIPFVDVPGDYSSAGIVERIKAVSQALAVPKLGDALARKVGDELAVAEQHASRHRDKPKVLFIISMTGGRINVSGTGTRADSIIRMAGGQNAMSAFEQYKILTNEAIISANPDIILMMSRGNDNHKVENEPLWQHPAISLTSAAKNKALIRMDGALMLGFGPRTAKAITALNQALYP